MKSKLLRKGFVIGALAVVYAAIALQDKPPFVSAQTLTVRGEIIKIGYTDDTTGENLIIRTTQSTFGGFDRSRIVFSVENISGQDDTVSLGFYFSSTTQEFTTQVREITSVETEYTQFHLGSKDISCGNPWQATTTEDGSGYGICRGGEVQRCDSIKGKVCTVNDTIIATSTATRTEEVLLPLTLNSVNKQSNGLKTSREATFSLANGETKYFEAEIMFPKGGFAGRVAKFNIEAHGIKGGYGLLDPWYDSNYSYCRKMTMTAGGTSGGVATTTTAGFPLVATSTITDLKATSSSGKVEVLSSDKKTPLDVVFTSGTDCNSDGGSLLDFYFEEYSSTTGAFVAWVQPTDISSTTAKTVLMYYGNSSATDQQDKNGVWDAFGETATYDLSQDPSVGGSNILDGTANNNHGSSTGSMTSSNLVTGYIDGALDFDGSNDGINLGDNASMTPGNYITMSAWFNLDTTASSQFFISKVNSPQLNPTWLRHQNGGKIRCALGGTVITVTPSPLIAANRWYHTACVYDGSNIKVYLDGAFVGQASKTGSIADEPVFWELGISTQQGLPLDGTLDNVRIASSSLHAMDILTTYNNEVDSSTFWTIGTEETESSGVGPVYSDALIMMD